MKNIKYFIAAIALTTISFSSMAAQSVSATGRTMDDAEAKIAVKAKQAGATSYRIIGASSGNLIHMTAELVK
ncbi:YdgH/BhsA/McbA family protein [Budvicia aquatica]|uniref:DUF1471 domain-containing protein n=1 Tax=Budvicia aquatica TaxID=82979 RepID=A0A2C6DFZ5_9GAMM|nr:DUF1471 domain-containing protein [Budvicia aquatica]PHI30126.1 DUF1471 domain-containing protein [Budvicia aquatica]VFS49136.1 Multiple stress resistance protein BhsA precursor [Budvicia aquatica]